MNSFLKSRALFMTFLCSFSLLCIFAAPLTSLAALEAPEAEAVYGGRINWIDAIAVNPTTTRVFISTESANSMFYADVNHSGTPSFGAYQVVPDLDANHGYGGSINAFAADSASGFVFLIHNGKLLSTSTASGSIKEVVPNGVDAVAVCNGRLFYMAGSQMHFGTINAVTGAFAESAASPLTVDPAITPAQNIIVNTSNNLVYIFKRGDPPVIYRSSDAYSALTGATTFASVTVTTLGTGREFRAFGIGPDGRIFAGASDSTPPGNKYIAYTDSNGDPWTTFSTGIGGTIGPNIVTSRTVSPYYVYFAAALSTNKGETGTWHGMPNGGTDDSHANDGAVFVDPNSDAVIYLTTDAGIGASTDFGTSIRDIVQGVVAVQINDFDMNAAKTIAWSASKSGVRQVTGYGSVSPLWSTFFPNDDGSPYYSIAMDKTDAAGGTAYAGNVRVYKTGDGGATWSKIFALEDYGSFDFASYLPALAISPTNPNILFVGANSPSSGVKGAVYYTTNAVAASPTWVQLDTGIYNTEVQDLLYVDGSPVATIYVGCQYVNDGTTSSYGVKTITYNSSAGTLTYSNDMVSSATGTSITDFGAYSLAVDSSGNVYAAGENSASEPRVYVRTSGTTTWTMLTTAGLPPSGKANAITIGYTTGGATEVPYIAIMEKIYFLDGSAWTSAYSYPVGMDINVLYWDDLLVGTGAGLYAQSLKKSDCVYSISTHGKEFRSSKGTVTVPVTATGATSCPAPAVTTDPGWITWSATPFKKNKGMVKIAVSANTSSIERNGTATIGNQEFTVTQTGALCSLSALKPPSRTLDKMVHTSTFTVTATPSDCGWTAAADGGSPWVTVTGGSPGTGTGVVTYAVTAITEGKNRTGKINVALTQDAKKKKVFTINQKK